MTMKAYAEIQQTAIEWIRQYPSHWSVGPLKFLMTLNPSKTQAAKFRGQSCSFVPMEKLKLDKVDVSEIRAVDEVIDSYTYFENGDVLAAKVTPCFENKNMAVAKELVNGVGFGSSEIYVMRPHVNVVPDFLFYRVQENEFIRLATAEMTGAGGLKRVPADFVQSFKVAIPPLSEQKQISKFLRYETAKINALIDEQKHLIELLKEKRQAIISHAVTKGLNPDALMKDSGVQWLGEVPQHWSVIKGSYIGEIFGSEAIKENEVCETGWLPFVKVSDLSNQGLKPKAFSWYIDDIKASRVKARANFITFPKRGAAIFLNKVNIIECEALLDPNLMGWQISQEHSAPFMAYVLKMRGLEELADISTVPQINAKHIAPEKFPAPPITEQKQIIHFLKRTLGSFSILSKNSEKVIELLKERRSALISAAVTGKIDVGDWQPPQGSDKVKKKESAQTEMQHG